MIKFTDLDKNKKDGQMIFDHYVYRWTSSERDSTSVDDLRANVCLTIIDEDAHLELWFKEDTRTLCEVCVVMTEKMHKFKAPNTLPVSNGLICIAQEIITLPRGVEHCLRDDFESYISTAISEKKIEIDFGEIQNANQKINGPNIVQFTKNDRLVGLSFANFQTIDYQS